MKREPNPYAQQRTYTVTQTMAISVPSVVAEDVLDGEDGGTTVDPEINGRIDSISGVVDLMDTRIDAVSEVANLAAIHVSNLSGVVDLIDPRIDAVSEVVDLMDTRIDAVSDIAALYGSSDVTLSDDLKKLDFKGDGNNKVIAVAGNFDGNSSTDLYYYALAAGAFANVENPECQLKVSDSGLRYTTDGGNTWTAVGGSNSSSDVILSDDLETLIFSGSNSDQVITIAGTISGATDLYALAASAFANADNPACRLKVSDSGLRYTTDGGSTWTAVGGTTDAIYSKLQIESGDDSDDKALIVSTSAAGAKPVMSMQLYDLASQSSQLYAIAAPWFAYADNNRYGMRIVPDSSLSNMLELTTNGGSSWNKLPWPTGSNSDPAYELGIWYNGADSGSRIAPLVKDCNIEADKDVVTLSWAVGPSTSDAQDTSGMYTLIGNPIALYDSSYNKPDNSLIEGAVRVADMHGTICWQRYSYTDNLWKTEPTGNTLPEDVTMELLPYNPAYTHLKGRIAQFTSSKGTLLATAPGIGLYTGNQSIVACLTAESVDTSTNKTTWKDYYEDDTWESEDNGHYFMNITELIRRRQQICDIAGHLSQIKWLCENAATIESLLHG